VSAPLLRGNTDLVVQGWLAGVPGLSEAMVASTLPSDVTGWAVSGFVQVTTVGGTPDAYVPMREPVVSVDCWAVAPNSSKPPWGKANNLAEHIAAACQDHRGCNRVVILPEGYPPVRVHQAYLLTEPRRIPSDDGAYARYQMDLALHWTEQ